MSKRNYHVVGLDTEKASTRNLKFATVMFYANGDFAVLAWHCRERVAQAFAVPYIKRANSLRGTGVGGAWYAVEVRPVVWS